MSEIIKLESVELNEVEISKAVQIRAVFLPMAKMLEEVEVCYNDIIMKAKEKITSDLIVSAKRLRLDISKIRIGTEKARQIEKEEYIRAGKAIDGVSNILKWAIVDKENHLKEIEEHFKIKEEERLRLLQIERVERMFKYMPDCAGMNFSSMEEEVFVAYFQAKKKEYEDKIEAEKKAKEEMIAKEKLEARERERINKENERLKKEAEERDRKDRVEADKRSKIEAERVAREAKEKKKQEEELRKERLKREKLEAEIKAKKESEAKVIKEESEQEEVPEGFDLSDSAKMGYLLNQLNSIRTRYEFKTKRNKVIYEDVKKYIDKLINYIKKG